MKVAWGIGLLAAAALAIWIAVADRRPAAVTEQQATPALGSAAGSGDVIARPAAAVRTCAELTPLHDQTSRDSEAAYRAALGELGLSPANLDLLTARAFDTVDEVDRDLPKPVVAWTELHLGRQRAVASEMRFTPAGEIAPDEFVVDPGERVFHVRRAPRARVVATATVMACAWGCWGTPGRGDAAPTMPYRAVWSLPPGRAFGGERVITYDAPTIAETIIDQNCGDPP